MTDQDSTIYCSITVSAFTQSGEKYVRFGSKKEMTFAISGDYPLDSIRKEMIAALEEEIVALTEKAGAAR